MTRTRKITSGTYSGLSAEAKADLYVAEAVARAMSALEAHHAAWGVEVTGEAERQYRVALSAILREAHLAGAEPAVALRMRAEHEQRLRLRYERALREAGVALPRLTD